MPMMMPSPQVITMAIMAAQSSAPILLMMNLRVHIRIDTMAVVTTRQSVTQKMTSPDRLSSKPGIISGGTGGPEGPLPTPATGLSPAMFKVGSGIRMCTVVKIDKHPGGTAEVSPQRMETKKPRKRTKRSDGRIDGLALAPFLSFSFFLLCQIVEGQNQT
ncbi:hypothetical protein V8F33_006527 [Rhypophila sp. PSN 637]